MALSIRLFERLYVNSLVSSIHNSVTVQDIFMQLLKVSTHCWFEEVIFQSPTGELQPSGDFLHHAALISRLRRCLIITCSPLLKLVNNCESSSFACIVKIIIDNTHTKGLNAFVKNKFSDQHALLFCLIKFL